MQSALHTKQRNFVALICNQGIHYLSAISMVSPWIILYLWYPRMKQLLTLILRFSIHETKRRKLKYNPNFDLQMRC